MRHKIRSRLAEQHRHTKDQREPHSELRVLQLPLVSFWHVGIAHLVGRQSDPENNAPALETLYTQSSTIAVLRIIFSPASKGLFGKGCQLRELMPKCEERNLFLETFSTSLPK